MNQPIDIVLPWVDGNDPIWERERRKYAVEGGYAAFESSNVRFQSWDNLHYWFRAIEKFMPWVHKIYLITCGHLPDFLVKEHPKLVCVKHSDYIPEKYLPTFNSNTIEMNLHRLEALSENYILFNDDFFPLQPIQETYYFREDKLCDEAVENIITTTSFGAVSRATRYAQVNNMFIINKYFQKRKVQAEHPEQWFCEEYGDRLERTKSLEYWYDFPGFYDPHMASAFKKSTLKKLWKLEPEALDAGSRNRFRGHTDITQYLARYWQLCEGDFYPRRTQGKVFFPNIETYPEVVKAIESAEYQMISFNENCTQEEFEEMKMAINVALEKRFPEKSSFEK